MRALFEWFTENRVFGISGLVVGIAGLAATILGLRLALRQIAKTQSAVESAAHASATTKGVLETGDLRRHLEVSAAKWESASRLPITATRSIVQDFLREWLAAYMYIVPLVRRTPNLDEEQRHKSLTALQRTRADVLDLQDQLADRSYFAGRAVVTRLQSVLRDYACEVRELDAEIRDSEVRSHGQSG